MSVPLVLVPGLLCDARIWFDQRTAVAGVAEVEIADHGTHDSLPAMARAILDNAPKYFAIAGHSMGGRVALEVLRAAPERVIGIALMDTGIHPLAKGKAGQHEMEGRFELLATARRHGMRAMAKLWVQGMVHPSRLKDAALINTILDMFAAKSPDIYAAQITALLNRPDASPLLKTIGCPTLILCGHEDTWAPVKRHQDMAAEIPGSTFIDLPNCGHMTTMERPQAVSEAMLAWLRVVSSAAERIVRPRARSART